MYFECKRKEICVCEILKFLFFSLALPMASGDGLDLHRSVLHTDLPAPYCFDCKSAAHQERQETTGYIYTLWLQIDNIGIS